MLKTTADRLNMPIRARVRNINSFYLCHEKPAIYFTVLRFEWCQCELTEGLIDDFHVISRSGNMNEWTGREIEVYARNGEIRARLYQGKDSKND